MSEIFISHAVADAPFARLLTNFLKEGVGVPQDAIFCSSVPGHGIPLSEDFNAYIKDQIQTPKLVILLMTPAYMESWFCLMELGAAWAKSIDNLAIVVPPVAFSSVIATLGTRQAWNISNHKGLVDFRAKIRSAVTTLEKRTDHVWEEKRDQWMSDLKVALQTLKPAQKVDAGIHEDALARIENLGEELAALERAKAALEAELAAVKKLKDPDAVRAHERASVVTKEAQAEFDELIQAVNKARPARIGMTDALSHLRAGDTLMVWKLDRLGRSVRQLVEFTAQLEKRGIQFASLTDGIDTGSSAGRFFFHVMAAMAEMERDLVRERTVAGLAAAKARGRLGGRPAKLNLAAARPCQAAAGGS